MEKVKNQLFLSIAVIIVLALICIVTVYENSQKEYQEIHCFKTSYGSSYELIYKEVFATNGKGKMLIYVDIIEPKYEEIAAKYQDFFDADPEEKASIGKNEYHMRWQKAKELAYIDRIDCFLEESNCHISDVVYKEGYSFEEIIMYATSDELEGYRTHKNVKSADVYTDEVLRNGTW